MLQNKTIEEPDEDQAELFHINCMQVHVLCFTESLHLGWQQPGVLTSPHPGVLPVLLQNIHALNTQFPQILPIVSWFTQLSNTPPQK